MPEYKAYCPNCGVGIISPSSNKITDIWFCSLECLENYSHRRLRESLEQAITERLYGLRRYKKIIREAASENTNSI